MLDAAQAKLTSVARALFGRASQVDKCGWRPLPAECADDSECAGDEKCVRPSGTKSSLCASDPTDCRFVEVGDREQPLFDSHVNDFGVCSTGTTSTPCSRHADCTDSDTRCVRETSYTAYGTCRAPTAGEGDRCFFDGWLEVAPTGRGVERRTVPRFQRVGRRLLSRSASSRT